MAVRPPALLILLLAASLLAAPASRLVQAARAAGQPDTCAEALTTAEMNRCADAEFAKADADLNAAYAAALASIPEMATGAAPYDAKSWENALRGSQRAWVAFRDAECEGHVAMFWTGGTGATVDIIGCKTEKTEQRTKELKARYDGDR